MILTNKTYYKILIVLSFLFLVISKALAGTKISTILSLALIGILLLSLLGQPKIKVKNNLKDYSFWIYITLFVISLIRQFFFTELSFPGFVNILVFFCIVILMQFVAIHRINPSIEDLVRLIYIMLNIYIVANLILYLLGIVKDRYAGVNTTFGYIGLNIDRVFFYFSPSMAYFAMLCGIFCIVSLLFYLKYRYVKYLFSFSVGILCLLLTDSRGPIFGLIIILILLFWAKYFWLKYQFLFFLFLIFSVNLFVAIISFIDTHIFDVQRLSRGGNTTLLSLRDLIWEAFFKNYDPPLFNLFFGYGNVGQKISGISSEYKHLFVNWPNPEEISLHNNTLQMLIDIGLIGILSFFMALYYVVHYCIRHYKQSKDILILTIPLIINYILLLGFSDIIINISNIAVYFIVVLIIAGVTNKSKIPSIVSK